MFLLFSLCLPPEQIVLVGSTLHLGVPQCFLLAFVMSRALLTTPLCSLFQIPLYHSPRRCRFASELSQQTIQTAFEQSWDTEVFENFLSTRELNQAFTILSDHAECALSQIAYPNRRPQKHVPRSALWQPSVKVAPSKSASQVESILLRRLLRLQRRLQHLLRVPHDVLLHENCDRNLASLSVQIPELTNWVTLTTTQTLDIVNIVTARLDEAEKQQRISAWRQQTHGSLAKQTAWIKRRCSIHAEIDTHTSTREVVHAIHPSAVAKEQQRAWMKHWCPTTSALRNFGFSCCTQAAHNCFRH